MAARRPTLEDAVSETLMESGHAGWRSAKSRRRSARETAKQKRRRPPGRSLRRSSRSGRGTAVDAVQPLLKLGASGAIRSILIPEGTSVRRHACRRERRRAARPAGPLHRQRRRGAAAVEPADGDLVARRTRPSVLDNLVQLADRLVLDADPPDECWRARRDCFERTALTDLRWTRLTRWRALLAHFFDLPEVRDARRRVRSPVHRGARIAPRRGCSPAGCAARCNGETDVTIEIAADAPSAGADRRGSADRRGRRICTLRLGQEPHLRRIGGERPGRRTARRASSRSGTKRWPRSLSEELGSGRATTRSSGRSRSEGDGV